MAVHDILALQIDEERVTLRDLLLLLRAQNTFHAIEEEIDYRIACKYAHAVEIEVSQDELQAGINNWRRDNELFEARDTQEWLAAHAMTMDDLIDFVTRGLLMDRVESHVAADGIEAYFAEHRLDYDAVHLSQIVLQELGEARELKFRTEEGDDFHAMARLYSVDEDSRMAGGYLGRFERPELPDAIAPLLLSAQPGQVVGPVQRDKRYHIYKVESVHPAELNEEIRTRIAQALFDKWLSSRRKAADIAIPLWSAI